MAHQLSRLALLARLSHSGKYEVFASDRENSSEFSISGNNCRSSWQYLTGSMAHLSWSTVRQICVEKIVVRSFKFGQVFPCLKALYLFL